jgi:hypothetical protein
MRHESGELSCVGRQLRCDGGPMGSWQVSVSDIAVVGEYTTSDGPFFDDYFFVFITRDGTMHEASFYADGRDRALATLEANLGARIVPALSATSEWRSRVLWPPRLVDAELFSIDRFPEREAPSGTFLAGHSVALAPDVAREISLLRARAN